MAIASPAQPPQAHSSTRLRAIERIIRATAELLPRQGPITKYAFLNPLSGLEHEHYDEVMRKVGTLYGNEAYWSDSRYRQKLRDGRITERELREVLSEDLDTRADESVAGLASRLQFRLAMLLHPLPWGHPRELDWVIAETQTLRTFRPGVSAESKARLIARNREWVLRTHPRDAMASFPKLVGLSASALGNESPGSPMTSGREAAWEQVYLHLLWQSIRRGVDLAHANPVRQDLPADSNTAPPRDFRDHRLTAANHDVDELMIRLTSAYLDQGHASAALPTPDGSYWNSFRLIYGRPSRLPPRWRRSLPAELAAIAAAGWSPLEVIGANLDRLAIPESETADYLGAVLLSLRGFAGMIWQTETRPDLFRKPSPPGTLVEFLAVRLLLLRMADQHLKQDPAGSHSDAPQRRERLAAGKITRQQLALGLFELAQALDWTPEMVSGLEEAQWRDIIDEFIHFDDHARRKCFHAAFERVLAKRVLHAFQVRASLPAVIPTAPSLQVVCCIDAREESFRRHLEELDPTVETFGVAGFFGVPMYFRGAGDADFSALCPIVTKPQHWVIEEAVYSLEDSDRSRARLRRLIGQAQRRFHVQSHSGLGGAIVSTLVGPLATIPMLSRILFPRLTAMMNRTGRQFIAPPMITRLRLERSPDFPPGPPPTGSREAMADSDTLGADSYRERSRNDEGIGFTVQEMTEMAARVLRDIGLTKSFAPLVILLGHGSGCMNNPHESSYHCGACAGNAGGPNARALAAMLNDHRVRRDLGCSGLTIPEATYFIGAQHNTATDELMFFDMELLPTTKTNKVRAARRLFAEAARRNAHERCRRFESADLRLTPHEALLHVQSRSEDLAQTRPEYGNGGNAICFVGRRSRIRGLYLDRRAFLMSYDAQQDDADRAILARILAAVVPVCQGINLQYTLAAIDPAGWGSGTKLPHNITSLIGVMDGATSDLRPGLPWQSVEIHEPVRLLFVIEASPRSVFKILADHPNLAQIFRNHWAHLATLDPETSQMHRFRKDRFVPYPDDPSESPEAALATVATSMQWYQGYRGSLPFALVAPTTDEHSGLLTTDGSVSRSVADARPRPEKNGRY